jgi:hypothetical protein
MYLRNSVEGSQKKKDFLNGCFSPNLSTYTGFWSLIRQYFFCLFYLYICIKKILYFRLPLCLPWRIRFTNLEVIQSCCFLEPSSFTSQINMRVHQTLADNNDNLAYQLNCLSEYLLSIGNVVVDETIVISILAILVFPIIWLSVKIICLWYFAKRHWSRYFLNCSWYWC